MEEDKFFARNIFESSFDSLDFDDGFLLKVDLELKKKNKVTNEIKCGSKKLIESDSGDIEKSEKISLNKFLNSPLLIEDFDDSDLFVSSTKKKRSNQSLKVEMKNENSKEKQKNGFTSCLSPILGPKQSNKMNLSSTPLKPCDNSVIKSKQPPEGNFIKNSELDFLEADLFDDWNIEEINNKNIPKETITISQAFKLIEEAQSKQNAVKESQCAQKLENDMEILQRTEKDSHNQSVDLLTGEIVGADIGNLFEDSFNLQLPDNKNSDSVIIEEPKRNTKPLAAQKLNFEEFKVTKPKDDSLGKICFSSDDDFDFPTHELLKKPKIRNNGLFGSPKKDVEKTSKAFLNKNNTSLKIIVQDIKKEKLDTSELDFNKENKTALVENSDFNESLEVVTKRNKKRGKCFQIIESDSEESPSPKFLKQKKPKKRKNSEEMVAREFLDSEAEVSDEIDVSSDEAEEDEGEYDKSFVDEESYLSQNCSADMTAKYLESVKSANRPGAFKIPAPKPFITENIFSQIPESNAEYEIDSFCVNEVEEDVKSDLSDLEIAEQILELDRKRKKKSRKVR